MASLTFSWSHQCLFVKQLALAPDQVRRGKGRNMLIRRGKRSRKEAHGLHNYYTRRENSRGKKIEETQDIGKLFSYKFT